MAAGCRFPYAHPVSSSRDFTGTGTVGLSFAENDLIPGSALRNTDRQIQQANKQITFLPRELAHEFV